MNTIMNINNKKYSTCLNFIPFSSLPLSLCLFSHPPLSFSLFSSFFPSFYPFFSLPSLLLLLPPPLPSLLFSLLPTFVSCICIRPFLSLSPLPFSFYLSVRLSFCPSLLLFFLFLFLLFLLLFHVFLSSKLINPFSIWMLFFLEFPSTSPSSLYIMCFFPLSIFPFFRPLRFFVPFISC